MAYQRRPTTHEAPRAALATGVCRPEMSRAPRKGVRFSVKLLWAR